MGNEKSGSKDQSFQIFYVGILIAFLTIITVVFIMYTNKAFEITKKYYGENVIFLEKISSNGIKAKVDAADIKNEQKDTYEKFLTAYYRNQSDWLNRWLAVLGMLLTFIGIITPLLFMRYYAEKKYEFEKLEQETNEIQNKMKQEYEKMKKTKIEMEKTENDMKKTKIEMEKTENDMKKTKIEMENTKNGMRKTNIEMENACEKTKQSYGEVTYLKSEMKKALKETQENVKISKTNYLLSEGAMYFSEGKYSEAIKIYKKCLKLNSKNVLANYNLGVCYRRMNYFELAVKYYNAALSIDSNYINAWIHLAACYRDKKIYTEAYNKLIEAEKIDKNNIHLLTGFGILYFVQENYDKSLEYYLKAYSMEKTNSTIYNLIEIYIYKVDFENALSQLKEFRKMENSVKKHDKEQWFKILQENKSKQYAIEIIEIINDLKEK